MLSTATYEDVNLILRLYELRREEKLRAARDWFAKNCKVTTAEELNTIAPLGSEENTYFGMVISYWEMVASFITSGVLNEELFLQSGMELLFCWERIVPHVREMYGNPNAWKNLEMVARHGAEYLEKQNKGAYAAFSARVRG